MDSNTVALGRVNGPCISEFVSVVPDPICLALAVLAISIGALVRLGSIRKPGGSETRKRMPIV